MTTGQDPYAEGNRPQDGQWQAQQGAPQQQWGYDPQTGQPVQQQWSAEQQQWPAQGGQPWAAQQPGQQQWPAQQNAQQQWPAQQDHQQQWPAQQDAQQQWPAQQAQPAQQEWPQQNHQQQNPQQWPAAQQGQQQAWNSGQHQAQPGWTPEQQQWAAQQQNQYPQQNQQQWGAPQYGGQQYPQQNGAPQFAAQQTWTPTAPKATGLPIGTILTAVAGVLAVGGTFLPWVSAKVPFLGGLSFNGLDVDHGVFALVAGILLLIVAGLRFFLPQAALALRIAAGVFGAVAAAIAGLAFIGYSQGVSDAGEFSDAVSVGPGLYVLVVGGVIGIASAIVKR
ncbi:hypothetical protein GCM10009836_59020 [Pseudonocardia ailaonensis]|uniref:Uncharacterized protein n=1 Tax=Pseudonocardia ailaonensis TaxID=367279 RepID=A0ABN2NLH0_9PSEU